MAGIYRCSPPQICHKSFWIAPCQCHYSMCLRGAATWAWPVHQHAFFSRLEIWQKKNRTVAVSWKGQRNVSKKTRGWMHRTPGPKLQPPRFSDTAFWKRPVTTRPCRSQAQTCFQHFCPPAPCWRTFPGWTWHWWGCCLAGIVRTWRVHDSWPLTSAVIEPSFPVGKHLNSDEPTKQASCVRSSEATMSFRVPFGKPFIIIDLLFFSRTACPSVERPTAGNCLFRYPCFSKIVWQIGSKRVLQLPVRDAKMIVGQHPDTLWIESHGSCY